MSRPDAEAQVNAALPEPPGLEEERERGRDHTDADEVFAAIAATTVDAPPRWREELLALPTWARVAVGALLGLVVPAVLLFLLDLRGDLDPDGMSRILAVVASCAALAVATVVVGLRGLHQRPLGWGGKLLVGLALGLPLVLAAIPGFLPGSPTGGAERMPWTTGCLWAGLVTALSAAGALRLLDRGVSRPRLLAAAGAGGLVGFGLLSLHCPMGHPLHLVTAHGLLGILVAVLLLGVGLVTRR